MINSKLLQAIVEVSIDGFWVIDNEGNILDANKAACSMSGYTYEELIKTKVSEIDLIDSPDIVQERIKEINEFGAATFETKHKRKDGSAFDVEIRASLHRELQLMIVIIREISVKKLLEAELKEQQKTLKDAQRIAHIGHWEVDLKTNNWYWSDEVYRILGLEPQEFDATYELFFKYIHPDDHQLVKSAYSQSLKDLSSYKIIHRVLTKNKTLKYVEERCEHVIEKGRVLKSIGTVLDITQKVLVEEEVQKQQQELEKVLNETMLTKVYMETVFNNSSFAIITIDTSGIITMFNKAAEELLGYTASEMVGKQTPMMFHDAEEIKQRAKEFRKEFSIDLEVDFKVITAKSDLGIENHDEWTYISKNGDKFPAVIYISKLVQPDSKEPIGYMGISYDISQKKEHEKQIEEYMSLIDEEVITSSTDLQGCITSVSNAFCRVSGYKREELIGQKHSIVKHPDMENSFYEKMWKTIVANKVWTGEIKNLKKDGDFYWVEATISPIYNSKEEKIGYTAIRHDITDKKRIELISITDGLTGIYNRRHFNTTFEKVLNRSKRDNKLVNFLIMDIDHFKQYNDTYGHQMGDTVLKEIAKVMKSSLRRVDDYCFRLGGEEFGILFNSDSKGSASSFAETVRANIEALKIEHKNNSASQYVTASMGLISVMANEIKDMDEVYKNADELLYLSKENGRNKVSSN